MMKPIVLMHSCSVWPMSIDFNVLRCYLEGYSVEETVEKLMTETAHASTARADDTKDLNSKTTAGHATMQATDDASTRAHRLQREDQRALGNASDSDTALLPERQCTHPPPPPQTVLHPRDGTQGVVTMGTDVAQPSGEPTAHAAAAVVDEAGAGTVAASAHKSLGDNLDELGKSTLAIVPSPHSPTATNTTTVDSALGTHKRHADGHKARRKGTTKHARHGTHERRHRSEQSRARDHSGGQLEGKSTTTPARTRTRRTKSFFLNEDYLNFQRRLMQVEGGPQSYAAALKSQLLFEEVAEQYQLFDVLTAEAYVGRPYSFLTCTYFPLPVAERLRLVRAYYPTDDVVRRYFFGDKMTKLSSHLSDPGGAASGGRSGGGSHGGASGGHALPAVRRFFGGLFAFLRDTKVDPNSLTIHNTTSASVTTGYTTSQAPTPAAGASAGMGLGGADHMNGAVAMAGLPGPSTSGRTEEEQIDSDLLALSQIPAVSLRRQWENIKNVASSLSAMYRGKGGLLLPRDLPLRTAVEQCYALEGELASSYATMTFGLEHRLTTKLFKRFHYFAEYEAVCTVLGSVWCDRSMLMLDEAFIDGCRRMSRLLEDTRVIAELHTLVFGEAMRPRWQVQLDEVQRAITTTSSNSMASGAGVGGGGAAVAAGCASPVVVGTVSSSARLGSVSPFPQAPSSAPHTTAGASAHPQAGSAGGAVAGGASGHDLTAAPLASAGALSGAAVVHASPLSAALTAAGSAASGPAGAAGSHMSALVSANKLFSRRLLIEFPGMMKHLSRCASHIGVHENINEALDVFFHRIYAYLETLSSRAVPGLVSLLLQHQQHQQQPHSQYGVKSATGPLAASSPSTVLTNTGPNARTEDAVRAVGGVGSPTTASPSPTASSRSLRRVVAPVLAVPASPLGPPFPDSTRASTAFTAVAAPATATPLATATTAVSGVTLRCPSSPVSAATPLITLPTALLNSSMAHPAATLLAPSGVAVAATGLSRVTSFASMGEGPASPRPNTDLPSTAAAGASGSQWSAPSPAEFPCGPTAAAGPDDIAAHSANGVFSPAASPAVTKSNVPPNAVETVVTRALDKRLLRELCQLFNALPNAWLQLTGLSAEDHDVCDAAFNRLAMAFKAISQLLMATDDFH